jgi:hypothetical protein
MKSKILAILVISMISVITINGQATAPNKLNPVGQWSYSAPYAPEGYQSGTVEIGLTEGKYTASFSVTGCDYKMPAEKVKFENDIVSFIVMVEGNQIDITLKMEGDKKMTGKAAYSEGEIPMTLTKVEKK